MLTDCCWQICWDVADRFADRAVGLYGFTIIFQRWCWYNLLTDRWQIRWQIADRFVDRSDDVYGFAMVFNRFQWFPRALYKLLTDWWHICYCWQLWRFKWICNGFKWFSMISIGLVEFADRLLTDLLKGCWQHADSLDDLYGFAILFNDFRIVLQQMLTNCRQSCGQIADRCLKSCWNIT